MLKIYNQLGMYCHTLSWMVCKVMWHFEWFSIVLLLNFTFVCMNKCMFSESCLENEEFNGWLKPVKNHSLLIVRGDANIEHALCKVTKSNKIGAKSLQKTQTLVK